MFAIQAIIVQTNADLAFVALIKIVIKIAAWFIGDTIVIVLLHMDYEVIGIQNMDIIKTPDESRTL